MCFLSAAGSGHERLSEGNKGSEMVRNSGDREREGEEKEKEKLRHREYIWVLKRGGEEVEGEIEGKRRSVGFFHCSCCFVRFVGLPVTFPLGFT